MSSSTIIGVDLGGTKTAIARYDRKTMEEQEGVRIPTNADRDFSSILEDLVSAINGLRTEGTEAVGIGVPGLVEKNTGKIVSLPNIGGAEGFPLQKTLTDRLRLKVIVDNDANCFALAEAIEGAGKGHDIVVGITMGTGVGGGIVMNGELFRGHHGFAAEIGHMLLQPGHPPYDADDKRGDIEQFLSGSAMGKRCAAAKRPEDYLEGAVCSFLQPEVFREVAWLTVNITHLLDPSIIIFGGSAGRSLSKHFPEIQKELKVWMLPNTPFPILASALLPDAATRGAATLTIRE
ncbi:MAG TPA: ROK family protein [Candidatus Peribacterales bacterium]|nr:ROK family protein [Candidatus Peribacterales bacterium]